MTELEKNKLIERTCKYHAYQAVYLWGKNIDGPSYGNTLWYAEEKMKGHLEWLKKQEYRYAFVEGFVKNDGFYERD